MTETDAPNPSHEEVPPSEPAPEKPAPAVPDYLASPNAVLNDLDAEWRYGKPPDYSNTRRVWQETKQSTHTPGSLPQLVENLVKNWEIEASFKTRLSEWRTIDHSAYTFRMNNGPAQTAEHMLKVGTYNAIIAPSEYYSPANSDFASSHKTFKRMMPTFAWEVLEVFSGPPRVVFKWRHWGVMKNDYVGFNDKGEKVTAKAHGGTIDITGVTVAQVDDQVRVQSLDTYYDPMEMFRQIAPDGAVTKVAMKTDVQKVDALDSEAAQTDAAPVEPSTIPITKDESNQPTPLAQPTSESVTNGQPGSPSTAAIPAPEPAAPQVESADAIIATAATNPPEPEASDPVHPPTETEPTRPSPNPTTSNSPSTSNTSTETWEKIGAPSTPPPANDTAASEGPVTEYPTAASGDPDRPLITIKPITDETKAQSAAEKHESSSARVEEDEKDKNKRKDFVRNHIERLQSGSHGDVAPGDASVTDPVSVSGVRRVEVCRVSCFDHRRKHDEDDNEERRKEALRQRIERLQSAANERAHREHVAPKGDSDNNPAVDPVTAPATATGDDTPTAPVTAPPAEEEATHMSHEDISHLSLTPHGDDHGNSGAGGCPFLHQTHTQNQTE